jgi:hypothetical protein
MHGLSLVADGKDSAPLKSSAAANNKNKRRKGEGAYKPPPDMPVEYLCQLSRRPMSEPVKSVYGNVYDKTAILEWLAKQGKICPLTG